MLTEQSVGRIMDADFARDCRIIEAKILSQAATSMLAQANVKTGSSGSTS